MTVAARRIPPVEVDVLPALVSEVGEALGRRASRIARQMRDLLTTRVSEACGSVDVVDLLIDAIAATMATVASSLCGGVAPER